jgi:hypothetical protein
VWLTPNAYLVRPDGRAETFSNFVVEDAIHFRLNVDSKVVVAVALGSEELSEIFNVVLRLLVVSVARSISFRGWSDTDVVISAPSLAHLMEQCQSLKILSFSLVGPLNSDHCRVLGAYSRPDLQVILINCRLESAGAWMLLLYQGIPKLPFRR